MQPLFRGFHPRLFTLFACGEAPPTRHAATAAAPDGQSLPCSLKLPHRFLDDRYRVSESLGLGHFVGTDSPVPEQLRRAKEILKKGLSGPA